MIGINTTKIFNFNCFKKKTIKRCGNNSWNKNAIFCLLMVLRISSYGYSAFINTVLQKIIIKIHNMRLRVRLFGKPFNGNKNKHFYDTKMTKLSISSWYDNTITLAVFSPGFLKIQYVHLLIARRGKRMFLELIIISIISRNAKVARTRVICCLMIAPIE